MSSKQSVVYDKPVNIIPSRLQFTVALLLFVYSFLFASSAYAGPQQTDKGRSAPEPEQSWHSDHWYTFNVDVVDELNIQGDAEEDDIDGHIFKTHLIQLAFANFNPKPFAIDYAGEINALKRNRSPPAIA